MTPPDSIDQVIQQLDGFIDRAKEEGSAGGYFPALYRRVTVAVKNAIADGEFDDNARMERLDVIFARRYLEAFEPGEVGHQPTRSWEAAFARHSSHSLIVLQHLLLGMNAHINLDLGFAAAETCAPSELMSLKGDFMKINEILGSLLEDTQTRLTRIFGPLGCIDRLLGPIDERISLFSMNYARDKAWAQAMELSLTSRERWPAYLADRDAAVAQFAAHIVRPPRASARILLWIVRRLERGDVRWRLGAMAG